MASPKPLRISLKEFCEIVHSSSTLEELLERVCRAEACVKHRPASSYQEARNHIPSTQPPCTM